MPRSRLPVVALLLAAIAAVGWLSWSRSPVDPARDATDEHVVTAATQADAARASTGARTLEQPSTGEGVRAEVPQATTAADGKALVRITTRAADGGLVGNVMVRVQRLHSNRISPTIGRGLTDEHGRVEFAGVEPGKLYISSDRRDQMDVEVIAGLNEVDFEVKAGVDVVGHVLDPDGVPVAGATIWLQTASTAWDGGRDLGETTADGTFTLKEVPANCSLGAFARGFAPSALLDLDVVDQSSPPARVELRLLPGGGELTGRVTAHDGAPVAGAQVAVGDRSNRADYLGDRVVEVWAVRTVETGVDGCFTILGVPAGENAVTARADGYGIWRGTAEITAGATTTLDVRLEQSAVLFGRVTDVDGVPEAQARVSAFDGEPGTHFVAGGQIDFDETFGHVETLTDGHGNYRLEGVTPGKAWVFVQRKRVRNGGVSVAYTRDTLDVAAGAELRWDPIIDVGRSIEGVVRYRDGYAAPHLFITLRNEATGAEAVINSGEEGEFRFLCLEDATYEVRVQPPFDAPKGHTAPRRTGIMPNRGPVEIALEYDKPATEAPGTVSGSIVDAGGRIRNPSALTVTLNSDARWFRPGIEVENGVFRAEDIRPCRFRLILKEDETVLAATDWFEMVAAADVDVGVLTTEPGGAMRIHAARADGAEGFEPKLYLRRDGDPLSTTIALGRRNDVLAESLTPGNYEVSGYCKGMVAVKADVTVNAGQTSALAIDLRPGAVGKVEVWWPENHSGSKQRGYRMVDAAGKTIYDFEGALYTAPTRPYELHYTLAAGSYHLEFWTDDGLRGELEFAVPESLEPGALRIDLR